MKHTPEALEALFRQLLVREGERWIKDGAFDLAANVIMTAVCSLSGRLAIIEPHLAAIMKTFERLWLSRQSLKQLGIHPERKRPQKKQALGRDYEASGFAIDALRRIEAAHGSGVEEFIRDALRPIAYAAPREAWVRVVRLNSDVYSHLAAPGLIADSASREVYEADLDRKVGIILDLARRFKDEPIAVTPMLNLFLAAVLVRAGLEAVIEPELCKASAGVFGSRLSRRSSRALVFDIETREYPLITGIVGYIGFGHLAARDRQLFRYLASLAVACPEDVWEAAGRRAPRLLYRLILTEFSTWAPGWPRWRR